MNERAIFVEALQINDPGERKAYLQKVAGGDAELIQRVERLLSADLRAGDFMEFANSQTAAHSFVMEEVGSLIGPYKLREELGVGGMGVVYAAEQEEPVRRKVALKIIKPGMDTREVISRFEAERQALAMMDHQNIARVLDAGTTESGRPYFVMELVRGVSVTQYCDKHKLPIRERLKLFVQICRAVQHAHQKGIIHRDIKPNNVMITLHDGVPVPKVIDFGVAKAINQRLTEATVYTKVAQMLGTPAYMSPEQAELSGLDVDTRSDIYSLGVMLYELLTGDTPFKREELADVGFDEMRRIIRENDPLRPSERLSTLEAEASSTIADQRGDDSRHLTNLLRGELDWIAMKALEKDRTRRYETANGFALDVQRYLDDEPVAACPPSTLYRFRKFARRNKVALAIGMLIALGLTLGIVGLSVSNYLIAQEREAKRSALQQAQENEKQAEANFLRAQQAVDVYLTRVSEEVLLEAPSMQPLRNDLLEHALKYYQEFIEQDEDNSELLEQVSLAHFRIGKISAQIGSTQEALEAHRRALEIQDTLVANDPKNRLYLSEQAESWHHIADIFRDLQQGEDAEKYYALAINRFRELLNDAPESGDLQSEYAESCHCHGIFLQGKGRVEEAEKYFNIAMEVQSALAKQNPNELVDQLLLGKFANSLGSLLTNKTDRLAEGLEHLQRGLLIRKQIADQRPGVPKYQYNVANSHGFISANLLLTGGFSTSGHLANYDRELGQRAIINLERAIAILKPLVRQNPTVKEYQGFLTNVYSNLGLVHKQLGNLEEAATAYLAKHDLCERLVEVEPDVPAYVRELASSFKNLGSVELERKNYDQALANYEKSIALYAQLVEDHPDVPDFQYSLAAAYSHVSHLHREMGDADSEIAAGMAFRKVSKRLAEKYPDIPSYQNICANAANSLGARFLAQGRTEEALSVFEDSRAIVKKLYQQQPDRYRSHLFVRSGAILRVQRHLGKRGAANSVREEVFELAAQMSDQQSKPLYYLALYADGRWQEALEECQESNRVRGLTEPTQKRGMVWWYQTLSLARLGEKEKATSYLTELLRELKEESNLVVTPLGLVNAARAEAAMLLGVDDYSLPASAWEYCGRRMYSDGRLADARTAFGRCIELLGETEPSMANGHPWWFLILVLAESGEEDTARVYYNQLCEQLEKMDSAKQEEFAEYRERAAESLDLELPTRK